MTTKSCFKQCLISIPSTATTPTKSCAKKTSLKYFATLRSSSYPRNKRKSNRQVEELAESLLKSRSRRKLKMPPRRLLKRKRRISSSSRKKTP
jgi:hypothetical protein